VDNSYPIDANSPYQKQRQRFKVLRNCLNGKGNKLDRLVYRVDRRFNEWEKGGSGWCPRKVSEYSSFLQVSLDSACKVLEELDEKIKYEMGLQTKQSKGQK